MAQDILRNEDFKTTATFDNVRGIIYKGNGSPVGRADSANPGAIYIDNYTGQLWVALTAGDPATWRPYFQDITNNIRIDADVQDGDLIGIFGRGSWATTGSMSVGKSHASMAGTVNASFVAGGYDQAGAVLSVAELFNGSIWSLASNLSVSKGQMASCGSQNAGLVAGGATTTNTNATELFNGSSWAISGVLSTSKVPVGGGIGTQNAGLVAGGFMVAAVSVTELFNGATWSIGSNLLFARSYSAPAGSQNAGLISAGYTTTNVNSSELFNGSAWSKGPVLTSRRHLAGAGSQNAAWAGGGFISASTSLCEIFNGSSWSATGVMTGNKASAAGSGSQNGGLVAGGETGTGTGRTRISEIHSQSTYRKLTYNSSQCALNIGMAYNVTTTSLTASVVRGDLPSTYIAGNKVSGADYNNSVYFGISRFNNVDNNVFVSSATATISSISVSTTHNATLNLSVSINTGFAVGGLLLISGGGSSTKTVIVGGTPSAPIVRWENVSSSASTSLTIGCLWGQRIVYNSVDIIAAGTVAYVTQSDSIAISDFYKGRYGDMLHIPYANVSGTNGSSQIAGTYRIASAQVSVGLVTYTIDLPTAMNFTETGIGKVTLLQQLVTSALSQGLGGTTGRAFSADDIVLGYRNKMRIPMNPFQDDLSNGRF